MKQNKLLRVGIIGLGRISASHIAGLENCPNARITALCDIDEEALNRAGDRLGIDPAYRFRDYRGLIRCEEVDAVEICTPNYLHVPMALEVIRAGKPVEIEKPLSTDMTAVPGLLDALESQPQPSMLCFSHRFRPAVRYAKALLEQGKLGQIVSVDVAYLQSGAFIPGRKLEWRFVKALSGSGALADLGVHLIDMTRYLLGEFRGVCGIQRTVVKQRPKLTGEGMGDVTVDDHCNFLAELDCGAVASFVVTRCARGHSNTIKYDIYGTEGVISFDLNREEELELCIGREELETVGLHTVKVPEEYRVSQEQTFVDIALGGDRGVAPDILDGVACQKVLDGVARSAETGGWIRL